MFGLLSNLLGFSLKLGSAGARAAVGYTIVVMAVTGVTIAAIGPVFYDTESVSADSFELGTLDIAASPASAAITLDLMAPGDQISGPLTLSNEGSLQARYAMRLISTEDLLATVLIMTVKTDVTSCDNDGFDLDGIILYGPAEAGSTDGISAFGDPAAGPHFGDRMLDVQTMEVLCVSVRFPISSDNSLQSASTTITMDFVAEFAEPD